MLSLLLLLLWLSLLLSLPLLLLLLLVVVVVLLHQVLLSPVIASAPLSWMAGCNGRRLPLSERGWIALTQVS
jgi:hypothetical protein